MAKERSEARPPHAGDAYRVHEGIVLVIRLKEDGVVDVRNAKITEFGDVLCHSADFEMELEELLLGEWVAWRNPRWR